MLTLSRCISPLFHCICFFIHFLIAFAHFNIKLSTTSICFLFHIVDEFSVFIDHDSLAFEINLKIKLII